jgi:hypothetical protein
MMIYVKEERMKRAVLALCVLVLTLFAVADAQAAYGVGDPIADFTLNDASGTPVSLFEFETMVVWLVFWTNT